MKEPKTSTELAKELGKHRSSISRVLLELEKKGFVKCVNPKDNKFSLLPSFLKITNL